MSSIHMTKLVTKSDRVEKLHGIIKSLLLTSALLDYFSLLLIQKNQSVSELIKCACFFLKILQQQFTKKHIHISNSKQHSASSHAVNSCRGGFSLKICLTHLKSTKHSYFSSGTEEQIIYHLIKT